MINSIKAPSFFRPTSRPSSPAPLATTPRPDAPERAPRPLTKLSSLSNFRRPSPAPAPPSPIAPAPLVQDGSYLETLALKLSEAVSKALAQPSGPSVANDMVGGKRPIPSGRGRAFGAVIASELAATRENPHLNRAIIRSLLRPLSVLLSNLSAHLLPIISSPLFLSPPAPTVQAPTPNPTQLHALAVSAFAGEVLEVFDELALGLDADARGDGLKAIREGLVSIITRVVQPLVAGIRAEMMPLLQALETPNSCNTTKLASGAKNAPVPHQSITALTSVMPVYARALSRYTASRYSQAALAPFLISVIWRGLVALASRPYLPPSRPPSPAMLSTPAVKKRRSSSITPPPHTALGAIHHQAASIAAAIPTRHSHPYLDSRGCSGSSTRLANEAIEEAFDGLKALAPLLDAVHVAPPCQCASEDELEVLTEELPTLLALPVLLNAYRSKSGRTVAQMLGLAEDEYRNGCLSGFARAEECAGAVGQRVLDVLRRDQGVPIIVQEWLEGEMADVANSGN
ncbi:hypothetical protein MSAN_00010400 [Mycena sanguinolenta]|uniref:Uncharacterized protein n=1 Tax=Mycena sanguinolenta TaxID=230812 RepID=A0A8H7DKR6_9AGAR|nr:hypothetical protein MSAN_00010400 [Mycena sanguinolenta]